MKKIFSDLIVRIKQFPNNFKRRWIRQDMTTRTFDLVWNALVYFAMTQVVLGLSVAVIMVFASTNYFSLNAAVVGSVFLAFIFEILSAIFIVHEFNTDSLRYRLDRIEQNTDTGVMDQLRHMLDEFEKKNGLS
jgi:hypothetical protein